MNGLTDPPAATSGTDRGSIPDPAPTVKPPPEASETFPPRRVSESGRGPVSEADAPEFRKLPPRVSEKVSEAYPIASKPDPRVSEKVSENPGGEFRKPVDRVSEASPAAVSEAGGTVPRKVSEADRPIVSEASPRVSESSRPAESGKVSEASPGVSEGVRPRVSESRGKVSEAKSRPVSESRPPRVSEKVSPQVAEFRKPAARPGKLPKRPRDPNKPPQIAKHTYWNPKGSGYSLEYKRKISRDAWDYKYLGVLSTESWLNLKGKYDASKTIKILRGLMRLQKAEPPSSPGPVPDRAKSVGSGQ